MLRYVSKAGLFKRARPTSFLKKPCRNKAKPTIVALSNPSYTETQIVIDRDRCRGYVLHNFSWQRDRRPSIKSPDGHKIVTSQRPAMRSMVSTGTELMFDGEVFVVAITNRRCLSRLPVESLSIAPVQTKLDLLIFSTTSRGSSSTLWVSMDCSMNGAQHNSSTRLAASEKRYTLTRQRRPHLLEP